MAEQFSNKQELNNYPEELTPEQLERARELLRQEEQAAAQEFSAAREQQAEKQAQERNKAEPPADIPGITRPEIPQVPLNRIAELNEGLVRGEAEKILNEVMANKQDHGGPDRWTKIIAALQESDTEQE